MKYPTRNYYTEADKAMMNVRHQANTNLFVARQMLKTSFVFLIQNGSYRAARARTRHFSTVK